MQLISTILFLVLAWYLFSKRATFAYRKGIRAMGMDYFLASERFMGRVADCRVHNRVKGSDHWPMELVITE